MDAKNVVYRKMKESEAAEVVALVSAVFSKYVSPEYSSEGIEEFFRYANVDGMKRRLKEDHFILVAEQDSQIVGMIEVRSFNHISLLFVDSAVQRRGIGKELVRHAAQQCVEADRSINLLTVNSSPNAVDAYQAIGFHEMNGEQEMNGIRFIPMQMFLTNIEGA